MLIMNFISSMKGNFRRIFPPEDKTRMEKYNGLLADAYKLFLSGKNGHFFLGKYVCKDWHTALPIVSLTAGI